MERTNVLNEKRKNTGTMYNLQSEVNLKFEKIKKNCSDTYSFDILKSKIMGRVVASEAFRDKKRDKKLERVLNSDRNNDINN